MLPLLWVQIYYSEGAQENKHSMLHNNAIWYEQTLSSVGLVTLLWWACSSINLTTHASAKHHRPSLEGLPPPGVLAESEAGGEPSRLGLRCFAQAMIFFLGDYCLSKIALRLQVEKVSTLNWKHLLYILPACANFFRMVLLWTPLAHLKFACQAVSTLLSAQNNCSSQNQTVNRQMLLNASNPKHLSTELIQVAAVLSLVVYYCLKLTSWLQVVFFWHVLCAHPYLAARSII